MHTEASPESKLGFTKSKGTRVDQPARYTAAFVVDGDLANAVYTAANLDSLTMAILTM